MCGIGGIIYKNSVHEKRTGEVVLNMLKSLYRRGRDSTGVALLHPKQENVLYLSVNYEKERNGERVISYLESVSDVQRVSNHGSYVRVKIWYRGEASELIDGINAMDQDISVANIGEQIEILKHLGGANNLEEQYQLSEYNGTVAIGHTRMATESKVDISHSQPLVCQYGQDLTIIHNGHVTNYVALRSHYEKKGYSFSTGNDSEVIAVYLTEQMANGLSLQQAMEESLLELDGSFSYIALTKDTVGLAKEPFGMKPMVIAETDDFVAFASENQAITSGFHQQLNVWEPGPEEVFIWNL
ncbi:hypothetical protein [Alteribacillus sp. YIM 98480]|uniref:hypothetical protein n=1 Tax=Alteribacillus sp. YIM 98480 TaxID=2606599 RepID=UPI00131E3C90|nr:hypothetical protein [Alteribacillus sp. YIM 98480]